MHCEKPVLLPIILTGLFLFIYSMPMSADKCSLPFSNSGIFSPTSEYAISHVGPHMGVTVGLFWWMMSKPKSHSKQTTGGKTHTSHFRKCEFLNEGLRRQNHVPYSFCLYPLQFTLVLLLPTVLLTLFVALPRSVTQDSSSMLQMLVHPGQK